MDTLSSWDQTERVSKFLVEAAVDLMKLNLEFISRDLKDGTADDRCYIHHVSELIERLEAVAVLMRDDTRSERATNIRIMKWKMANPMDEMFSRPWEIDYALNEDAY